jgi:hypothetical protein
MIPKHLFSIVLMMFFSTIVFAQRVKTVRGEYTYIIPENVTFEQAKAIALERAKLQALADEFGTVVAQTNSTVVNNESTKGKVSFFSISSSDVKGEWIEDTAKPVFKKAMDNNAIALTCIVCGKAREIVNAQIQLNAQILRNGLESKFESNDFHNGDDMYLLFQSPADGYVAVYLVDQTPTAFCLLPYRNDEDGQQVIKHGETYIFFSPKTTKENPAIVDEYTMTCNGSEEHNQIYIIFSPKPFTKAVDSQSSEILPRQLDYETFTKWLATCRRQDTNMVVTVKNIDIRKN